MSKVSSSRFRGAESLDAVVAATVDSTIDCLVIAAHSPELLSQAARDYLKALRSQGAHVEFHQKGGVEAVVHTANRLLADIPVESLSSTTDADGLRLLVIDNAESLPLAELQAAQRVARALKGSAFRAVLFWRMPSEGLLPDELQQFLRGTGVWVLDLAELSARAVPSPSESVSTSVMSAVIEPPSIPMDTPAVSKSTPVPDAVAERVDVLAELAAERARERGFDATDRSWLQRYRLFATAALLLAVLLGGAWVIQMQLTVDDRPRVYDCGTYPDEATLNVVRERLGRGVPTNVLREQEKWRLQVGPFEGLEAAERHLNQIWAVGACRVNPVIVQEQKKRG
jgi:hypothetical protein